MHLIKFQTSLYFLHLRLEEILSGYRKLNFQIPFHLWSCCFISKIKKGNILKCASFNFYLLKHNIYSEFLSITIYITYLNKLCMITSFWKNLSICILWYLILSSRVETFFSSCDIEFVISKSCFSNFKDLLLSDSFPKIRGSINFWNI